MSSSQSRLDGTPRDVIAVRLDARGQLLNPVRVGTASSYAAARRLVSETGYLVAPGAVGDCGAVVSPDGLDAFAVAVLV
ncbi:hypothetical protein [Thiocapsa sp.]|uniref:hypothetical protein n=1 Tax=Thiocapsa sp. TaxID=2024551 RepID=UPI0035945D00